MKEQTESQKLWQHIKKGHKKTKPWDSFEDFRTECKTDFPEDSEAKIQFYWEIEIERWHNGHHEEHQDYMMHIVGPYQHSN